MLDTNATIAPETRIDNVDPATLAIMYAMFLEQQKTDRERAKAAREESAAARAALTAEIAPALADVASTALAFHPVAPSEKTAWVGATVPAITVTIDGREYAISLSIKDIAATAARKS